MKNANRPRGQIRGLPQGGALEPSREQAASFGEKWAEQVLQRSGSEEPRPVTAARADYSAGYNSTTGAPSQPLDGVATSYGRVWAEARSVTHSGGSGSVAVTLISTQNGVRAVVTAPAGQTIAGGSVRFWNLDPVTLLWAVGTIDETLTTGTRSAATSDQFMTVGAQ